MKVAFEGNDRESLQENFHSEKFTLEVQFIGHETTDKNKVAKVWLYLKICAISICLMSSELLISVVNVNVQ